MSQFQISIPKEFCSPELMQQLREKGIVDVKNEANFTGKQIATFLLGSIELFAAGLTIMREFVPAEENKIVIVVDGEKYKNLTIDRVEEIIKAAQNEKGNVAYFSPTTINNAVILESSDPTKSQVK